MNHPAKQSIMVGISAVGLLVFPAAGQSFEYALFRLPVLSEQYPHTWTNSINNHGEIVGGSNASYDSKHAVVWDREWRLYDLGTIGGDHSQAKDINIWGDIVGESNWLPDQSTFDSHAFFWSDGTMIDLGTLGGEESDANAINDLGQVTGIAWNSDEDIQPFIWENGEMQALPGLDGIYGYPYDINNVSQIVGKSAIGYLGVAALWEDGEVTQLPSLDGGACVALAINDRGEIVGQSDTSYWGHDHACVWVDGEIFDLHKYNLSGPSSSVWGINNVGQAVGWIGKGVFDSNGFVWDLENGMRLLNDLIPPNIMDRLRIDMSFDINDSGQIAANGLPFGDYWNDTVPLLLSPVYPSFDLSLITPGVGGEVNTITASNLEPGTLVYFTWSRHGGGAKIPGCDIQTNALQIENPKSAGYAVADENGDAILEAFVAPHASGLWVLVQAVVPGECAVSNLVVQKFE